MRIRKESNITSITNDRNYYIPFNNYSGWDWWFMPIISDMWEVEKGGLGFEASLGKR
jgi:hypothetical protein